MRLGINSEAGCPSTSRRGWKIGGKAAVVASALLVIGIACDGSDSSAQANSEAKGAPTGSANAAPEVQVVTTLYPIEFFTERVAADRANVVNLVDAGAEAHHFEPTTGDMRTIQEADILIHAGAGFEPWVERALDALGESAPEAVAVAQRTAGGPEGDQKGTHADGSHDGEGEGEHDEEPVDPHVWLDPLAAIDLAGRIRDALTAVDGSGGASYAANASALERDLRDLHDEFASGLANCRFDTFVTSHAAYGYLADRYDLHEAAVTGISPEAEPKPGSMARLADRIRELGLQYLFVDPILDPRTVESLAREVGAEVLSLHPLESLTPEQVEQGESYFTIMRANLQALQTGLECRG